MAILLGLLNQSDLFDNRVSALNVQQIFRDVDLSVAEHNRQLDALMNLFVRRVTQPQARYQLAQATRLQPLDENGRARPIKGAGSYTVGFPLHDAGIAWGRNYKASVKMTLRDLVTIVGAMQDADSRWIRDHILAGLFFENGTTPWTFNDIDDDVGALSIYGMANGDTTTYQILSGADSAATDDHVKGAAAVTTAVFQDIHDELEEHPENNGQVIAFIPTASRATVEGLTEFYPLPDANLRSGSGVTELASSLNIATPGELIGYIAGVWVFVWAGMPAGYIIGTTVGGEPALGMREEAESELRGFRKIAERADHPWWEAQYIRIAGFGAWNRVGAVIYKTDNATYAIPTGYTSPMV
jgi:hypothetical protein